MPYSSYDHDKLETAETMRIERRIYFEAKDGDIAPYVSLPPEQLHAMREESAAAEQAIFNDLSSRAAAWEEQAGKTLLLDKAIEYTRTTVVQHTSNEWQKGEYDRYTRSNRVYQMNYSIYENTRYDKEAQKSIPYSWTLTWSVRTNSPSRTQAKIAGQDRKVFSDKAAMEKYLNGRIKAYDRLFTEISPPIPQEYAEHFKVNGMLLPGYTIEGEEPPQQQPQAAAIPETTGQQKERDAMPREKFGTLTEPMFYTLLCLREPCCGADIMAKVRTLTQGRVGIGPGTLYNLLEEFLSRRYIRELDAPGRRRVYQLTAEGRRLLDEEYRRLCRLAGDYRQVFGPDAASAPDTAKEDAL